MRSDLQPIAAAVLRPEISIIIVNYNAGPLLRDCIDSIISHVTVPYEIIIYDNQSTDDSLARIAPQVARGNIKIQLGGVNIGFARGNNQAALLARGRFYHFLNPDIAVNDRLEHDYRRVIGSGEGAIFINSLVDQDGRLQRTTHLIPTVRNYWKRITSVNSAGYWSIGASIIMPASVFHRIGGWPEDYFMYAEDLDLFYRAHRDGINMRYFDTRLLHYCRGCTRHDWDDVQRAIKVERSYRHFYRKYKMPWQYYIIRIAQMLFMAVTDHKELTLTMRAFWQVVTKR